jgi:type II secretory pathway component PulK
MLRRKQRDRSGVAMILVLLIVPAVLLLVSGTTRLLMVRYAGSASQRTRAAGDALLESGLELSRAFLRGDMDGYPEPELHLEKFSEVLEQVSGQLESATITGSITAEQGRISLGVLAGYSDNATSADMASDTARIFEQLVQDLCDQHGIRADPADLLTAIAIWGGAKDTRRDRAWYASRDPSYAPSGGPLLSPDQLLLLRWPDASRKDLRLLYFGSDDVPGLRDFVTVWSEGPLDMRAAAGPVVAAVAESAGAGSDGSRDYVADILDLRAHGDDEDGVEEASWYRDAAEDAGLNMESFPARALGSASNAYRVDLAVQSGAGTIRALTVLRRTEKKYQELFRLRY